MAFDKFSVQYIKFKVFAPCLYVCAKGKYYKKYMTIRI